MPFYLPNSPKNQNSTKMKKTPGVYHHFTIVYHKSWLHALLFLIYGAWQMWLFFILGHFLPFYIPNNPKNENFKKWKKCPEISYSNWNTLCLQTHLFLHVMIRWVIQTICFDFANTHHVTAGKFSAKLHGTYRCHIWTQYGPYIRILAFLIYIYIYTIYMFHLHPYQNSWSIC